MALKTARRYAEQRLEFQAGDTKVAVICVDTPLDCFSPMINRIIHDAFVTFSTNR